MAVMLTGVVDHEMDDVETHEDVIRQAVQTAVPNFKISNLENKIIIPSRNETRVNRLLSVRFNK